MKRKQFRHLVCGVYAHGPGRWGALGISRCPDLMTKPLRFPSLAALVADFRAAWEAEGLRMLKVTLGAPVRHAADAPLEWVKTEVCIGTSHRCLRTERVAFGAFDAAVRELAAEEAAAAGGASDG